MTKLKLSFLSVLAGVGLLSAVLGASSQTQAATKLNVNQPAPVFTAKTSLGDTFNLADHKGKTVVLEWTNHKCPFVVKHYETNNMQSLQKELTKDGVVWVSIVSSAPGKQGHVSPEQAVQITKDQAAQPSFKILDDSGEIGKLYNAKTTPHMFVINPEGELVYQGAIDDNSSYKQSTVDGAKNYVRAAYANIKAGEPVAVSETKPYGCSVKY